MDTCGLADVGYRGSTWTFEKKVAGGTYTRVRLDRCVANAAWLLAFPSAVVEHKISASYDHIPILLKLMDTHACRRAPRMFRYETCWERDPTLAPIIQAGWTETEGTSVQAMKDRLRRVSGDLAAWDKDHFGNIRREIAHLKTELQRLREVPGRTGPVHAELKINERLVELFHREEMLWRQRARIDWLVHGDKNTYFFHLKACRRRRKNNIKSLLCGDG